jgi:hypothetical protein
LGILGEDEKLIEDTPDEGNPNIPVHNMSDTLFEDFTYPNEYRLSQNLDEDTDDIFQVEDKSE